MRTIWKVVDVDGDEIDTSLFKPGHDIPVTCFDVETGEDAAGDWMIITLRYLHDMADPRDIGR